MTEHRAVVDAYRVPDALTAFETWVIWDEREKVPLAPWATGDMYRAGWGDGVVADANSRMQERPETDYETARRYAEIDPAILHETHSFPRGEDGRPDLPDRLTPTILLPHYPPDPPIMQVDLDDVRDPETGAISREVAGLIEEFDAYTEVSTSGAGLHMFVRAELPGQLGKFLADLDESGAIELYDHGRFTGCTWRHVEGAPVSVPERQAVVEAVVRRYEDEVFKSRRRRPEADDPVSSALAGLRSSTGSGNRNAYFDIDIRGVADRGYFSAHRRTRPGDEWTGPHPKHGPLKSDIDECTNFRVDEDANLWYCFAHGVGGGPLQLIAVLEGITTCATAGDLTDSPTDLLKTCLAARDTYAPELSEENPPYAALRALAEENDLVVADPDQGILGRDGWRIAKKVYDGVTAVDV